MLNEQQTFWSESDEKLDRIKEYCEKRLEKPFMLIEIIEILRIVEGE